MIVEVVACLFFLTSNLNISSVNLQVHFQNTKSKARLKLKAGLKFGKLLLR